MEAIFILRQVIQQFRENKRDLYMLFFDLEKLYDRVPRNIIWHSLGMKNIPKLYIELIKDIYEEGMTCVQVIGGKTSDFLVTVVLHQGSSLSPYPFAYELKNRI